MIAQERPAKCTERHLRYLDRLRETGITNMWGATPYLQNAFKRLSAKDAGDILSYWMASFGDRHKESKT